MGASGTCWTIVNCPLPVPGGMSMQLAPSNLTQHLLQRAHDHRGAPDYRVSLGTRKPKPVDMQRSRNSPFKLGPFCRPNVGRPQSRNFTGTGDVARRVEDPSFGDRSHLVLLPARHNIRLAISGAWSRARIEATSRLPEPVCDPMELVPGSLEIIEKAPGAPGPAAVTQGADRGVARLCHRL